MFNHSCCPNVSLSIVGTAKIIVFQLSVADMSLLLAQVTHRLGVSGRRIFEASRDINPGEECCISYFDLVEFTDTKNRQVEILKSWSFVCRCQRCVEEGEFEIPHFLKGLEF